MARESYWPFDVSQKFVNPGWSVMRNGAENKIAAAYRIDGRGEERCNNIIAALAAGKPVVYGTKVGGDWHRYRGGVLGEESEPHGGHATTLVGWTGSVFIGENSWGRGWGEDGFYKIDPEVIGGGDAYDFWTATIADVALEE